MKRLKIISVILLLCGFMLPMYSIYPRGWMIDKDSWFLTTTFQSIFEEGPGALKYLGVVFHLAVWIPAIILCIGSFVRRNRLIFFSAVTGIVLLLLGLLLAVIITKEIRLIHPDIGHICIGYWIDLLLFMACAVISSKRPQSKRPHER